MSRELAIEVSAASSPEEALESADVVITATNSRTPVFDGNWLKEGTHSTSISNGDRSRTRQEIDGTTIQRANTIFITSKETVCVNESDIFRAIRDKVVSWDRVHEISPRRCREIAMEKYHYRRMVRDYLKEYEIEIGRELN